MSKQESNPPEDSEDNFGLPEIDFKPIDRDVEPVVEPADETTVSYNTESESIEELPAAAVENEVTSPPATQEEIPYLPEDADEEKTTSPVVLGLIIVSLVAAAVLLTYFFIYKPKADKALAEKEAKAKIVALKEKEKQDSLFRLAEENRRLEAERNAVKPKPAVGTIETLADRTQLYYVIVTSNIDDDLVMDFAKKLSLKGVSTKIIPPFGKNQYYRLSISEQDTFAKAQADADGAKAEYGNSLWVIKY